MIARSLLIAVGCVGFVQLWRGFERGAVPERETIRRDEHPLLYWSLMASGTLIVGAFFYFAAFGNFS